MTVPRAKHFEQAYKKAPRKVSLAMNKAMRAGMADYLKNETDKYFQFKTPRGQRTGNLQRFFQLNTATGIASLAKSKTALYSETFSTVNYADRVAEENPFYQRILDATERKIDKHYATALQNVLKEIK